MQSDTRQEDLDAQAARGTLRLFGLRLVAALAALSSTVLEVAIEPGVAVMGGKAQQFAGRAALLSYSGSTLADGSSIRAAVVVYLNPITDRMYIVVVDGAVAVTGSDVAPTDAQITAALPSGVERWTLAGLVRYSRSGTAIALAIDHVARSYGVLPGTKYVTSGGDEQPGATGGMYRFFQRIQLALTAVITAAGNRVTSYPLPPINGKIGAMRAVIGTAPVGAGGTMLLNAEINGTDVTGGVVTVATGDAIGDVKAGTAITAANTFGPGSTLDIEAATVTAMTAGAFTLELDIYEAV